MLLCSVCLLPDVLLQYFKLFIASIHYQKYIKSLFKDVLCNTLVQNIITGLCLELVANRGSHFIMTSSAWLDVKY